MQNDSAPTPAASAPTPYATAPTPYASAPTPYTSAPTPAVSAPTPASYAMETPAAFAAPTPATYSAPTPGPGLTPSLYAAPTPRGIAQTPAALADYSRPVRDAPFRSSYFPAGFSILMFLFNMTRHRQPTMVA